MKKIVLICLMLCGILMSTYSAEVNVSDVQYQNYLIEMKNFSDSSNAKIDNVLRDIDLTNDEYVIISGNCLINGKLTDFHIDQSNIGEEKENIIIEKLKTLEPLGKRSYDIYNPDEIFDKFNLFIGAKPSYETNEGVIVAIGFGNDKLVEERERMLLKDSLRDLFTELLTKYNSLKDKNEIKSKITFSLTIDRQGNIISKKLLRSAGYEIDKEMLTILDNKKVKPLPKDYKRAVAGLMPEFGAEEIVKEKTKTLKENRALVSNTIIRLELDKRGNILSSAIDEKYSSKQGITKGDSILNNINKIGNFIELLSPMDKDNTTKYLLIQGYNIAPIEKGGLILTSYMRNLEMRIRRNWNPPIKVAGGEVDVLFSITRNGKLASPIKIIRSSGNQEYDLAVKKAIELSEPFNPIPQEYKGDSIDIGFTFPKSYFSFYDNTNKETTDNAIKNEQKPVKIEYKYDYLNKMKKMK